MNTLKSIKNIFDTIERKSVTTHSVEGKLAYEDCLCLLMPHAEILAKDREDSAKDLVELAAAFAKFAKKKGVQAI